MMQYLHVQSTKIQGHYRSLCSFLGSSTDETSHSAHTDGWPLTPSEKLPKMLLLLSPKYTKGYFQFLAFNKFNKSNSGILKVTN